jgi:hypothetical protein
VGIRPRTASVAAVLAIVLSLLAVKAPAADNDKLERLDQALLKQAPLIIKHLQDKGYKNIGVLKFQVKKGENALTDNAGPINLAVANQLEVALLIANDNDVKKQLGLIARASDVAAGIKGGSHLTADGRQKLLAARYPLAWGNEEVTPDALLTGVVEVGADLRTLSVNVQAFDKNHAGLQPVVAFKATNDSRNLVDSGESFLVRGVFDKGEPQVKEQKAIDYAARVKSAAVKNPLQDPNAPVALDILYDGKRVPVSFRDGQALVAEPQEGQKVELVLRRVDAAAERYGVVLFVNGENTLYKQRLPAAQCSKWVLSADSEPLRLKGFKTGVDKGEAFRVLSRAESKKDEVYYGADVGTIAMVVFREKRGGDDKLLSEDEQDLAAIYRGVLPAERPKNLGALKQQLHADASRGLIGSGEVIKVETNKVKFNTDPTPVMSVTIRYYKP